MAAKSRRQRMRERILREWRGVDEPLDPQEGMHIPVDALDGLLHRLGIQNGLDEQRVKDAWRELAGDFIAAHSVPASVSGGLLVVRVTQPAMRFHLEQMKPMLLQRVGGLLGEGRIHGIRFSLG